MLKNTWKVASLPVMVLGLVACGGPSVSSPSVSVSEAEVKALPREVQAKILSEGAAVETAEKRFKQAQAALATVKREVQIAEIGIDRAELTLEIVDLRFKAAQETKDAEAMLPAKAAREAAAMALQSAKDYLAFQTAMRDLRAAELDEAAAAYSASMAVWEQMKFEAMSAAGDSESPGYFERKTEFEKQTQDAELTLSEARKQTASAEVKMKDLPQGIIPEPPKKARMPTVTTTTGPLPAAPAQANVAPAASTPPPPEPAPEAE